MKIIPLGEGRFTVDATKRFIPFESTIDELQERSKGSLLVEVQPFALIGARDIIIVDTGLGFTNHDGTLQIHQNLLNNGIGVMDVTKVLLSHLHKDHAGGMTRQDKILKKGFLSFPNATYYVNKEEFDLTLSSTSSSFIPANFQLLHDSDNVVFTTGDGIIDQYIHYTVTGAHSPFHQVFRIEEEGHVIFYGGDVAPQLQQMRSRFIAKYDYEGKKCMELRQQWWQQGKKEHWTFLFYHDIQTPVYSF